MTTPYHTRYFAHELTRIGGAAVDRLSRSLFDACVDLNPHQIEAALFGLRSPASRKGDGSIFWNRKFNEGLRCWFYTIDSKLRVKLVRTL